MQFTHTFKCWTIITAVLTVMAIPYALAPEVLFMLWVLHFCFTCFAVVGGFDLEDEY